VKPPKNFSSLGFFFMVLCPLILFGEAFAHAAGPNSGDGKVSEGKTASVQSRKTVREATTMKVYYFHGTARCVTCRKIEQYTREAVELGFSSGTYAGRVVFIPVNVEEPANGHFVDEYKLVAKSVIIQPERGGKPGQWENLDKIWMYAGDRDKFLAYVKGSVLKLLGAR